MTVQLTQQDFQHLARIVQSLPEFANERDRWRLVAGSLEGVERSDVILARLDLGGSPMMTSVEVIRLLASFGKVAYGKEALGVFLNYIQAFTRAEDADFISRLFAIYSLDIPVRRDHPVDNWRGTDSGEDIRERSLARTPCVMSEFSSWRLRQPGLLCIFASVEQHINNGLARAS